MVLVNEGRASWQLEVAKPFERPEALLLKSCVSLSAESNSPFLLGDCLVHRFGNGLRPGKWCMGSI